jgi:hypothetical protein
MVQTVLMESKDHKVIRGQQDLKGLRGQQEPMA